MKKTYSKPVISFECFQLASSIASTCAEKANSTDVNSCSYTANGLTIFVGAEGCMPGLYDEDNTCYHNALSVDVVFAS